MTEVQSDLKHQNSWLWVCWCLLGWCMIATKRYLNQNWLLGQMLHSLCGYFIALTSGVWAIKTLKSLNWTILKVYPYTVLSLLMLSAIFIATLSGMTGAIFGRFFHSKPWLHHKEI